MRILGEFRNSANELISLTITNPTASGNDIEIGKNGLFFSDEPITLNSTADDCFTHTIKTSCTINLLTNSYLGNYLYSKNQRNITVRVEKGSEILFDGFIEPNTYQQGYSQPLENFTINCLDYLSILKYQNYQNATADTYDELKSNATTKSFKTILQEMFNSEYSLYFDQSKGISEFKIKTLFEDVGINELMFFDDDFDKCWKMSDVLNEILRYLDLHIIQLGKNFYIFDWNTIKEGKNKIFVDIITNKEIAMLVKKFSIKSIHHADDNTNISIDDVYNQIQVNCSLNGQDMIIESPLDKENLKNYYNGRTHYMTEYIADTKEDFDIIARKKNENTTDDNTKIVDWYIQPLYNKNWKLNIPNSTIDSLVEHDANGESINAWKLLQYGKKNQLIPLLLKFGKVENKPTTDNSPVNKIDMKSYLYISINGNADNSSPSPTEEFIMSHDSIIEYVGNKGGGILSPSDSETINYLIFSGTIKLQPIVWEVDRYPNYIEKKASLEKFTTAVTFGKLYNFLKVPADGGDKYYIRQFYRNTYPQDEVDTTYQGLMMQPPTNNNYKFDYNNQTKDDFKYDYTQYVNGTTQHTDKFLKLPILECELIIGDKRLVEYDMDAFGNSKFKWIDKNSSIPIKFTDNQGNVWTYPKTTFSIGVNPTLGTDLLNSEIEIQNTVDYKMNVDGKGMAIPIKQSDNIGGKVYFRILGPCNATWDKIIKETIHYYKPSEVTEISKKILPCLENIIISDFEVKVVTSGGEQLDEEEKDLIYLSDEQTDYVSKKDDIDFKIITQLSSKEALEKNISPSICINAALNMTTNLPLKEIYNKYKNTAAKAEELYVDSYYSEYASPKLILETNLHVETNLAFFTLYHSTGLNKNFFALGLEEDLKRKTKKITMRETY